MHYRSAPLARFTRSPGARAGAALLVLLMLVATGVIIALATSPALPPAPPPAMSVVGLEPPGSEEISPGEVSPEEISEAEVSPAEVSPEEDNPQAAPPAQSAPAPLLAYYYIWFDPASWNRAKTDYPLLGRYSSDDPEVMRRHIRWAKEVGIEGFIVSWKSTTPLNRRLTQLIRIAGEEEFKLSMIYQGLDFERNPLPVDRIAADMDYFLAEYAADPVFDMFGRPVMIWSGTWKFARDEVARVRAVVGDRLLLLASEKNVAGYERLADLVDGDAYYWSSVNPETYPNYPQKLQDMSRAINARDGLWIAPFAPGFDARLIGGTQVIERKDGLTLRQEMNGALQSAPDALGLISWNEFSENSHVEPSRNYGRRYLDVLADIQKGEPPPAGTINVDSSDAAGTGLQLGSLLLLGGLGVVVLVSLGVIVWRTVRGAPVGAPTKLIR